MDTPDSMEAAITRKRKTAAELKRCTLLWQFDELSTAVLGQTYENDVVNSHLE